MALVAQRGLIRILLIVRVSETELSTCCLSCLVLPAAFHATGFSLATLPLAFAISHATHGLTALVPAVVCRGSRCSRGLETPGPIAHRPGRNFFHCVTTRPVANRGIPRSPFALLSPTSLSLGLRVFLSTFGCRSPSTLPLGHLPSPQLPLAEGDLAIPLPPVSCPISPSAAFAEASTPTQPSPSGRDTAFGCMLGASHGRLCSLWGSPGRFATPPRALAHSWSGPAESSLSAIHRPSRCCSAQARSITSRLRGQNEEADKALWIQKRCPLQQRIKRPRRRRGRIPSRQVLP